MTVEEVEGKVALVTPSEKSPRLNTDEETDPCPSVFIGGEYGATAP